MVASEIIVALITGGLSLIATIISVSMMNSKTLYRIEQIEKKLDKHNNMIERIYILEKRSDVQEEQIKVANHRIEDLEHSEGRYAHNIKPMTSDPI